VVIDTTEVVPPVLRLVEVLAELALQLSLYLIVVLQRDLARDTTPKWALDLQHDSRLRDPVGRRPSFTAGSGCTSSPNSCTLTPCRAE